jgi:RNA polymerase sigma-70 factor (sigma-E family)
VVYHHEEPASGGHVREEEFQEFVLGRSTALLRTAYLLTHDWGQAEDLLQTALAKNWFARGRITTAPEVYARATMANTYASWWRRRWRGEVPTALLPERAGVDPMLAVDDRVALWRALGRLPRRQRAVLVLRYYEGLSEAEIAEELGCAAGTVKSQAAKALAALRSDPDTQSAAPIEERCL